MCNDNCKGLIFSGYENIFYSNGRFESTKGVRLLKRQSCKTMMNERNGLLGLAIDWISEDYNIPVRDNATNSNVKNGKKYKLEADSDGEFWFKLIQ